MDREKIIKGLERCLICDISVVAPEEAQNAYLECEYTVGLYCGKEKLLRDTIALLKKQEHKDKIFHALEEDWKRLKTLLKEHDNCENCAIAIEDRQPVVRCKDCKHKEESVSPSWEAWCNRLHCGCDNNWYCADGERS